MYSIRKIFHSSLFIFCASFLAVSPASGVDVETTQEDFVEIPYTGEGIVLSAIGGQMVAFGGRVEGAFSEAGVIYVSEAEGWKTFEVPFELANPGVAPDRKSLYVVGGEGPSGLSREVYRLDLEGDNAFISTSLPVLPEALAGIAAIVYKNHLFVAGETVGIPKENRLFRMDTRAADPTWEVVPVWGEFLREPFFGVQNSQLFVSGILPNDQPSPIFRLDDVKDETWEAHMSAPFTLTSRNGVAVGHSNILFAFENPDYAVSGNSHSLLSYNVITDRWARTGVIQGDHRTVFLGEIGGKNFLAGVLKDGSASEYSTFSVGMASRPFGWIDYSIIVVYIIALVAMGFYFSRKEKGSEDYFVGGRKVPWWAVGLSLYATGTSAISFMAISGRTYSTDWLYFTSVFFGLLLAGIIAVILVPLIRRLNVTSTYEYLELRFHVSVRLMGSLICILTQLGSRMAVVLFLPALALSKVTGIDVVQSVFAMGFIATLYTYLGGIKAVIWTDVVQVIILLGGAFFCLGYVIVHVDGGFVGFIETAGAYEKLKVFDWRLTLEAATVWVFFLAAAAGIMTIPNDQVMMQRVLSTTDEKAATNSIWTMALMTIPGNLVFFSLGTALWVFYANFPDRLDPSLQFDATFPHFVAHEFPVGLAGLVISALFAASMSTLDSGMNSVSTIITVDFYKRFKKDATDADFLRLARIITILAGVFSTIMALVLTRYSLPSLWDTMILLTGLIGGGFGGVFALGMLTRRANATGCIVGIITSLIAALAVRQWGNVHVFMITPVAVFTVVIVGYLVSLVTPEHGKNLRGLTLFPQDRVPKAERMAKVGH